MKYQLDIQRELRGSFVVSVGYLGSRGADLEVSRSYKPFPNQYLSTSPVRDQAAINYLSANLPNPFGNIPAFAGTGRAGTVISRSALLSAYPHFSAIGYYTYDGQSWYDALNMKLEKRFSHGYLVSATYTFSKFMEAVEVLNAADPRPTEVLSAEDRPHRFAASGIYELPFGKNRKYLGTAGGVTNALLGGWQVSAIYAFQSGPPINFGNVLFTGNIADTRLSSDQQSVDKWFNTEAGFNKITGQQLVSNVRTFPLRFGHVRAQTVNNVDFGAIKKFYVGEGKEIQFRAEFLNFFNHPLLFTSQINVTPNDAGFGKVTATTQENYSRRFQMTFKFVF